MNDLGSGQVLSVRHRGAVNAETVIRAKSPLRISFAGGGTDLPEYYQRHGGAVLSCTINRYSHVTLYPRSDAEIRIRSLDVGFSVRYELGREPISDGVSDLARAAIRRMGTQAGFELDVQTEAPRGSGLGGSSAMTSAVIGAVMEYTGVVLDSYELAELNYAVERLDLGVAGGKQDQYATTFGGFNVIEFLKDRVVVTPLRIPQDLLNDLEAHLMLCYTGKVRPGLGLVEAQLGYFREGRADTLRGMQRLHELAHEMKEALLKRRLLDFGRLLHEVHESKRLMNPLAIDDAVERLYAEACRHGAVGGKLLGAGGGGYLLVFAESDRRHELRVALEAAGGQVVDFGFDQHGLQVWRSTCR